MESEEQDFFQIFGGPPLDEICENVYLFTRDKKSGRILVDLNTFECLTAREVLQLFTELPKVQRFAHPEFEGVFRVTGSSWATGGLVRALISALLRPAAPNAVFIVE